jgi:hypothetical protein
MRSDGNVEPRVPPHGIDLIRYAAISADLAEGDRSPADVIRAHDLTDAQWIDVTRYWSERMTDDARESALLGEPPRVTLVFSDAFARAQDAKRPIAPLDVRAWAALKHDVDARGPGKPLADRGLRLADYSRLVRHWARALASDPELATAFDQYGESV